MNRLDVQIFQSSRPSKKFMAVINNDTVIHFGQHGASDYTVHKDKERKERFLKRMATHIKNNGNNYYAPIFWSTHLLWNKPTLKESIKWIEKNYPLDIEFVAAISTQK